MYSVKTNIKKFRMKYNHIVNFLITKRKTIIYLLFLNVATLLIIIPKPLIYKYIFDDIFVNSNRTQFLYMISILLILEILTQILNFQSRKVMTKMDNLFLLLSQKKSLIAFTITK